MVCMLVTCKSSLFLLIRLCFSRLFMVALSSFRLTGNGRYLRWQGIEARHACTEADLLFVAEVKYKCSIEFRHDEN